MKVQVFFLVDIFWLATKTPKILRYIVITNGPLQSTARYIPLPMYTTLRYRPVSMFGYLSIVVIKNKTYQNNSQVSKWENRTAAQMGCLTGIIQRPHRKWVLSNSLIDYRFEPSQQLTELQTPSSLFQEKHSVKYQLVMMAVTRLLFAPIS